VDTTGAGDAYAGGFLYGLARGWELAACGHLASIVAGLTVAQVGGVVRDRETLLEALGRVESEL
jgi:sugar/nucleoside kinase (ribokinase family)